ncbi:peroxiredoxin [Phytoactinopolyspora alkaliphila]|uniref:Alkyl hydroperoxide reductase E n=1 Tax=Phytoactinopolyspora alkaliphila TaxID=1783498 RepID=A0A6N9YN53_9ACTN|nr:peroxiredoxin [Phytoactinopolyspora alkaliphila]NED96423.1 peroxiredoxin [Phytoactinopolyspora alkaliphila]
MNLSGRPAPDFDLPDHHGAAWRLSSLRGQPVLIVFYPYAFTGVCTGELRALRDDFIPSMAAETQVLAVSCDSMFSLRIFAEQEKLEFPLLSDYWPHGAVASSYGVLDQERGCARRASFLVDAKGKVQWSVVNAIPQARDIGDYRRALAGLTSAPN